jgi:hypothetical protein
MIVSALLQFCTLHPFLLMLLLVASMLLIFYKTAKKSYILWTNFAWLLPLFGIANFIYGSDWNSSYVYKHGEKGTGIVIRIAPTNTWVNRVREVEYLCLIKTKDKQTLDAVFVNNDHLFYPKPKLWMPPQVGEQFDIKYIPGNESNFIILTRDPQSPYANKITCMEIMQQIASAQAAYNFDKTNTVSKKAYVRLLRRYIAAPCDENVKKAYTLLLERIESGEL